MYPNPRNFPLLHFDGFKELEWHPVADLHDGDILAELCDIGTPNGRLIYKTGLADMLEKKVPYAIQHTSMKTTVDSQPRKLEAVLLISENPLDDDNKPCVIIRPRYATPEQIERAIAHGRTKLGQAYGFEQVIVKGLNLWWPWANVPGNEEANPYCSFLNADQYDHADYPPFGDGSRDHDAAPWDWISEAVMDKFYIAGRCGRRE